MKKITAFLIAVSLLLCCMTVTSFAEEKKLSKDNWSISASSSFVTGDIGAAFDGNTNSYWHTDYYHDGTEFVWVDKCPHAINVMFKGTVNVSGFEYLPRQDNNDTGNWKKYRVFASDDGKTYKQIYEGEFTYEGTDRSAKKVSWGNVAMRAIQIEIISSQGGYGTAAEVSFFTGGTGKTINNGEKLSVEPPVVNEKTENPGTVIERGDEEWKVSASSNDKNNGIANAFDGKAETYWHTAYQTDDANTKIISHDECPHTIDVVFPEVKEISGFVVTPRTGADLGKFQSFDIYSSMDGEKYDKIFSGNFTVIGGDWSDRSASWGNTKMKAIRIVVTSSQSGFGTAAEIKFLKDSDPSARIFDTSKWQIAARTETKENSEASWGAIRNILDGNPTSRWHAFYETEGNNITSIDKCPFWIEIVLPEKDTIEGFAYTPRDDAQQGRLITYNINVSDTDNGDYTTIYNGNENVADSAKKEVNFGIAIEVKRIQIEILDARGGYGAISDFVFTPGQNGTRVVPISDFNDELYNTFLYEIDKSGITVSTDAPASSNRKFMVDGAIDGTGGIAWLSESTKNAASLFFNLGGKHIINEVRITPYQSSGYIGYWEQFDILVSNDGKNYEKLVSDYSFPERSLSEQTVKFDKPIETKYIQFKIKKFNNSRIGCAEISFMQTMAQKDKETGRTEKYTLVIDSPVIKVEKEEGAYEKTIDAAPYISIVGSTLIPLRGLLEEMGATVEWIDKNQTIIIDNGTKKITMQVGSKLVYIENSGNEVRYTMTAPPKIKNGRTYIPVRFVSEHLGYTVGWDGETRTITIG